MKRKLFFYDEINVCHIRILYLRRVAAFSKTVESCSVADSLDAESLWKWNRMTDWFRDFSLSRHASVFFLENIDSSRGVQGALKLGLKRQHCPLETRIGNFNLWYSIPKPVCIHLHISIPSAQAQNYCRQDSPSVINVKVDVSALKASFSIYRRFTHISILFRLKVNILQSGKQPWIRDYCRRIDRSRANEVRIEWSTFLL